MSTLDVKAWIRQSFEERFPLVPVVSNAVEDAYKGTAVSIHVPEVENNDGLYRGICTARAYVDLVIATSVARGTRLGDRSDKQVNENTLESLANNITVWSHENQFFAQVHPDGHPWPEMMRSSWIATSRLTPEAIGVHAGHIIQFSVPCNIYFQNDVTAFPPTLPTSVSLDVIDGVDLVTMLDTITIPDVC